MRTLPSDQSSNTKVLACVVLYTVSKKPSLLGISDPVCARTKGIFVPATYLKEMCLTDQKSTCELNVAKTQKASSTVSHFMVKFYFMLTYMKGTDKILYVLFMKP